MTPQALAGTRERPEVAKAAHHTSSDLSEHVENVEVRARALLDATTDAAHRLFGWVTPPKAESDKMDRPDSWAGNLAASIDRTRDLLADLEQVVEYLQSQ